MYTLHWGNDPTGSVLPQWRLPTEECASPQRSESTLASVHSPVRIPHWEECTRVPTGECALPRGPVPIGECTLLSGECILPQWGIPTGDCALSRWGIPAGECTLPSLEVCTPNEDSPLGSVHSPGSVHFPRNEFPFESVHSPNEKSPLGNVHSSYGIPRWGLYTSQWSLHLGVCIPPVVTALHQ